MYDMCAPMAAGFPRGTDEVSPILVTPHYKPRVLSKMIHETHLCSCSRAMPRAGTCIPFGVIIHATCLVNDACAHAYVVTRGRMLVQIDPRERAYFINYFL